ncbi:hypothetical protein SEA_APOCALYPSE_92 [Mycobacterium phage Apocalypse]|uniref:Uncharacterized protein n=1 Tax=Mycobacterium phage Apocalypse TaxID=2027890 RepID=A0A249XLW9_9CAUD|nr:hypothetical protein I5G93_gp12 [Mycobacterium phage Apocalypse]ASZ72726.1 hypothetical protein SEA_APOCALYPSE_92 [Mycobacterium phage Apocalypse]
MRVWKLANAPRVILRGRSAFHVDAHTADVFAYQHALRDRSP